MDEIDRGQKQEQETRDLAIKAQLQRDVETESPDEENGIRYCLDCGLAIPTARLEKRPQSVRCVECKEIQEIRGRR